MRIRFDIFGSETAARTALAMLLALALPMACAVVLSGCEGEAPEPAANSYVDENADRVLGTWSVVGVVEGESEVAVDDAYPRGFTLELLEGGSAVVTRNGETVKCRWSADASGVRIRGYGMTLNTTQGEILESQLDGYTLLFSKSSL